MNERSGLFSPFAVTAAVFMVVAGCSSSSGPGDTTVALSVEPVASPTNQLDVAVTGTTDPGATVVASSARDTAQQTADAAGAFSLSLELVMNASNDIVVSAVDSAGNQIEDTLAVDHDGRAPANNFLAPAAGSATAAQSDFDVSVRFDEVTTGVEYFSGIDAGTFQIESDQTIGGVFQRDGTFSASFPAGTDLTPLFDEVLESGAAWLVPDSAAFSPGTNSLFMTVSDRAGNQSATRQVTFEVTGDPDQLIPVDATGTAGSSGNPLVVGLANADSVAGVQFDLTYNAVVIASVDSVTAADRAVSFAGADFNEISPGRVRVVLFDVDGDLITPGQGPVLTLWLSVGQGAASGSHPVFLEAILLSDRFGATSPLSDEAGQLTVP